MKQPDKTPSFMNADRIAAIVFSVFLLVYGYESLSLPQVLEGDAVGPSFFPLLLMTMGIGFSLILFIKPQKSDSERKMPGAVDVGEQTFLERIDDLVPLLMLLAYVALLFPLGFVLSTFIYGTLSLKLLLQPTWRGAVVTSTVLTASVYVVFKIFLEVPLPVGLLFEGILGGTYGV
jgi:putative tricarboxylic transport membrane protein